MELKQFIEHPHTLEEIFSALVANNIVMLNFKEYSEDVSELFNELNGKGLPLSFILQGEKSKAKI
jgi:hypothetical protein